MKEWSEAVNARKWERACEFSAADGDCVRKLRQDFADARLTFEGPAESGGGTKPGEEYFSFGGSRGTVFVTAIPHGDDFRVRVEAVVAPSGTPACTGHNTVTVTHAPPRRALYDILPMFKRPNRRWTAQRARELLHVRRGPALIGVHIDNVRDLGTHFGVRFQAVPVAQPILGGPAECAPEYDPAAAYPMPGVCLAWWPDRRTANGRARDCLSWLQEGTALGVIPLGKGRMLANWVLPAGRHDAAVIPTGRNRKPGRGPIRFKRVAGQLHLAVTTRWPSQSFDYRYVEDGQVVRQRGPYRGG